MARLNKQESTNQRTEGGTSWRLPRCRARTCPSRCGPSPMRSRTRRSTSCATIAALPWVPARRGHAGRAPGQGRDRRLRHRDAAARLAGRGRRRHRVRDGRGVDQPDCRGPARRPARRSASTIEAAIPVGFNAHDEVVGGRSTRLAAVGRVRRAQPTKVQDRFGKARQPDGHARRRQPLHRAVPRRRTTGCG